MKFFEKMENFFRGLNKEITDQDTIIARLKDNDPSLTTLESYSITDKDIENFCAALASNTHVTSIDFSYGHGKITDVGAKFIARLLRGNDTVHHVCLQYNNITDEGVYAIAEALCSKKSRVASINLSGNKISPEGAVTILQFLRSSYYGGVKIILRNNKLGDLGAIAMAQSIEKNNISHFFVDLEENEIGGDGAEALDQVCTKKNWAHISNSLRRGDKNPTVGFSHVSLEKNPISDKGAKCMALNLARDMKERGHTFENVVEFAFCGYAITHKGVIDIVESLGQFNMPLGFDLSKNKIGPEGALAIGKLLLCNSGITSFNISDNKIGLEGVQAIARFLEHNRTMVKLDLLKCAIGNAGTIAIAKSLEKNNTLKEIFIGCDEKDNGGGKALLKMLETNTTIVSLGYHAIDFEHYAALQKLLERNREIASRPQAKKEIIPAPQVAPPPENREKEITRPAAPAPTRNSATFSIYNPLPTLYSFFNYLTPLPQYLLALPVQFITTMSTYITPLANVLNHEEPNSSHSTQPTITTTTSIASNSTLSQNIPIPAISLEIINQLSKEGINIAESLTLLSTFHAKHEILKQALLAWEKQAEKDATEKAELEIISQDPEVKYYYQMMKSILECILMAAIVIASGKVSSDKSFVGKVFEGLCTLAGAAFLEAVPALGFIKMAASTLDSTITYREMQQHLRWVELKDIPEFAALLARRLALAKKSQIVAGINHSEKSTWEKIKSQCNLIAEELKSGQTLSDGERRALLDAQDLFKYMLSHDAPSDMTLNGRVNLLLQQMVGSQYVYTPPAAVAVSSSTAKHINIETTSAQANATKQEMEQLRQELSSFKTAHEKNQQNKQEQAQQILELEKKLQILQQKLIQPEISYFRDNENGTMSVQNRILINSTQGSVPIEAILKSLQQQLAQMSEAVSGTALVVHQLQGQQGGSSNIDKQTQAREAQKNKEERKSLFGFF